MFSLLRHLISCGVIATALSPSVALSASPVGAVPGELSVSGGSANYTIPIAIPAGRGGIKPQLSVNYSHGRSNGVAGLGWSLSGASSVVRCGSTIAQDGQNTGIFFDERDHYCLDGQRLVAVDGDNGDVGTEYRTEVDSYTRVMSRGGQTGHPDYFDVWTKSGDYFRYGGNGSDVSEETGFGTTVSWSLTRLEDSTSNNGVDYEYVKREGMTYLTRLEYEGGRVSLHYEWRHDVVPMQVLGREVRQARRLSQIKVYGTDEKSLLLDYRFSYTDDQRYSLLTEVTQCGSGGECVEPTTFDYSNPDRSGVFRRKQIDLGSTAYNTDQCKEMVTIDMDRDGLADQVCMMEHQGNSSTLVKLASQPQWRQWSDEARAFNVDHCKGVYPSDLNKDGVIDFLCPYAHGNSNQTFAQLSKPDGRLGAWTEWASNKEGVLAWRQCKAILPMDANGDGLTDLVCPGPAKVSDMEGGFSDHASDMWVQYSDRTLDEGLRPLARAVPHRSKMQPNDCRHYSAQDVNGDGLTDVACLQYTKGETRVRAMLSAGDGFTPGWRFFYRKALGNNTPSCLSGSTGAVRSTDLNADGNADWLCTHKGRTMVQLSTGDGFLDWAHWNEEAPPHGFPDHCNKAFLSGDITGDGLPDNVCVPDSVLSNIYYQEGTGTSFKGWQTIETGEFGPGYCNHWDISDLNGDLTGDLSCFYDRWGYPQQVFYSPFSEQVRLVSVTPPRGEPSRVVYRQLTDPAVYRKGRSAKYPNIDNISTHYVVSKLIVPDGVGGEIESRYQYESLVSNLEGRGSYGFGKVIEIYPQTGRKQVTTMVDSTKGFPLAGRVLKTQEYIEIQGQYQRLNEKFFYYGTRQPYSGVVAVDTTKTIEKGYDLDGDLKLTIDSRFNDVDRYGNTGEVTVLTIGNDRETYSKTTTNTYDNDPERWHLGRLMTSTAYHRHPNNDIPTTRRQVAFEYDDETGLLTREKVMGAKSGRVLQEKISTYDQYGQKIKAVVKADGQTRQSTIQYNAHGQVLRTCIAYNLCAHNEYNNLGQLTLTRDVNGLETTYEYDGLGRQSKVTDPLGNRAETRVYWADSGHCGDLADGAHTCVVSKATAQPTVIVQKDSLGRTLRTIGEGFNDQLIYTDTEYNALGQVTRTSRPYHQGDYIHWATSEYDALDRVVRLTEPAHHGGVNEVTTEYDGYITRVYTGSERREMITQVNALGRVIMKQDTGGIQTVFTYTADGNPLTTVVNGRSGTRITLSYDEFGRKVAMDDPDMGHWTYAYNGFGELIEQKDAKGVKTTMVYDKLGRMIERHEPENGSTVTSTWAYYSASANPGQRGQLRRESGRGLARDYEYDNKGRVTKVHTYIAGETFTTRTTYDSRGRADRVYYPGSRGFFTKNVYDDKGFLTAVMGTKSQSEAHDLDALRGLVNEATDLAAVYQDRADELQGLGRYYQDRVKHYQQLLDKQTITFEQGTTEGLKRGQAYDYLRANDGVTSYIRQPHWLLHPAGGQTVIMPPKHHYKVVNKNGKQSISVISADAFNAIAGGLTKTSDPVYILDSKTISCACDKADHDRYERNLKNHENILMASVREGRALSGEALYHVHNAVKELNDVQRLLYSAADRYASNAHQLVSLAEQTLVVADHHFEIASDLNHSADIYTDLIEEQKTTMMSYWRAADVDASGRITAEVYGNGVVNDYAYDQATGQLNSIHSSRLTLDPLRHLEYQYDEYQNVTLRHDLINDLEESFRYDHHDRLTDASIRSDLYQGQTFNRTQSVKYDAYGNITHKSDVGDYSYGSGWGGIHAVTQAGSAIYDYDANGNMVSRNGDSIEWTSFNKASHITQGDSSVTFRYGPDHRRFQKTNHKGDVTVYIGQLYERTKRGRDTDELHYIYAGGQLVAQHIRSSKEGVKLRYLHKDALGSIDLITDAFGNVVDRRYFDAWGKQHLFAWEDDAQLNDPLYLTQLPYTNKGYTGHEQVQEVDLIHMNGRMYDATLGRFISADPHIQAPSLSQSYNRYSYVLNNPMKYSDPSGYFFKSLFKKIRRALSKVWKAVRPYTAIIVGAALFISCGSCAAASSVLAAGKGTAMMSMAAAKATLLKAGAVIGGISSAAGAAANGASVGETLKAGVIGAAQGAAFAKIGMFGRTLTSQAAQYAILPVAHGVVGGTSSVLQGGKFGRGFAVSALTKGAMIRLTQIGFYNMEHGGWEGVTARTTVAAMIGGSISEVTGGKFANGARSAALAHLLNAEMSYGRNYYGECISKKTCYGFFERRFRNIMNGFWDARPGGPGADIGLGFIVGGKSLLRNTFLEEIGRILGLHDILYSNARDVGFQGGAKFFTPAQREYELQVLRWRAALAQQKYEEAEILYQRVLGWADLVRRQYEYEQRISNGSDGR